MYTVAVASPRVQEGSEEIAVDKHCQFAVPLISRLPGHKGRPDTFPPRVVLLPRVLVAGIVPPVSKPVVHVHWRIRRWLVSL